MMNPQVVPHYEKALQEARNTNCGELSEVFLNQATGMIEYGLLCRDMTADEFERQIQRIRAIRVNRDARSFARGAV